MGEHQEKLFRLLRTGNLQDRPCSRFQYSIIRGIERELIPEDDNEWQSLPGPLEGMFTGTSACDFSAPLVTNFVNADLLCPVISEIEWPLNRWCVGRGQSFILNLKTRSRRDTRPIFRGPQAWRCSRVFGRHA